MPEAEFDILEQSRVHQLVVYCLGMARELRDDGLISGSLCEEITDKGMASYWRLIHSGFEASEDEVKRMLYLLMLPPSRKDRDVGQS